MAEATTAAEPAEELKANTYYCFVPAADMALNWSGHQFTDCDAYPGRWVSQIRPMEVCSV